MMLRPSLITLVLTASFHWCFFCSWAIANDVLTYEQHIRPIFRAHCFDCHGATEELEGELDLRQVRLMKKGGSSGSAIELDNPASSLVLIRIQEGEMPPGEVKLSDEEIQTLRRWIEQGAATARPEAETIGKGLGVTLEERSHWAYQAIQQDFNIPKKLVSVESVVYRNTIDLLVQWRIEEDERGKLFDEADRPTLIKRAFFDLVGLPPAPEQVRQWSEDDRSDWYEHLVTYLLGLPAYGERWGRHWLDIAGYADSEGYTVKDAERSWAWDRSLKSCA